ncbi:uncharacterized protein LOC109706449 isoform X2 [Ananas comosus]|uniref:Uncharacterized protein LOC109706449 isoform X2 n=1 Tax=Ananas comosus TaxID=4615 RepID=A0A6P5EHL9_ANACO|nr:uncharacterized protein LOC109706449 isoform X2 [Ananas comosus]
MGAARCRSMNLRMLLPVGQRGGFCDNRGDRNGLTMDDTVDDDLNYSTATPTSTLRLLLMRPCDPHWKPVNDRGAVPGMAPAHRPEQGWPNKQGGAERSIENPWAQMQTVEGMVGDEEERHGQKRLHRHRVGDSGPDGAC